MNSRSTREDRLPDLGESNRLELEAVVASLERTPKLANLLRYLVEKYLSGETGHLTEYEIATEVFERSRTSFIASEDSIARVQTHRLRKKLKEYYDGEGREHSVKVSIPLGTYVPVFTRQTDRPSAIEVPNAQDSSGVGEMGEAAPAGETAGLSPQRQGPILEPDRIENKQAKEEDVRLARRSHRAWIISGIAAIVVLLLLAMFAAIQGRHFGSGTFLSPNALKGGGDSQANGAIHPAAAHGVSSKAASVPLRMIAGYDGPPEVDSSGNVWQADKYFHNGWGGKQVPAYIAATSDQVVFRYGRSGDCDYNIPLDPGTYELHLYFMQGSATYQSEDDENKASFDLAINGQLALSAFDIVSDAGGRNIADERIVRDVTPAADGVLHLHISTVVGTPFLSAIEILKGTPHQQLPLRIITQPTTYTDRSGRVWHPDTYFIGGRHLSHSMPSTDSPDADWLFSERYGHFNYAIPVDPRDRYTVVLHFVELFFGSEESPGGVGRRVFRVMCNGNALLEDFDIYRESGFDKPIQKTYYHLKPNAQGKLNLTFEPIVNYATVSAIEVIDESN